LLRHVLRPRSGLGHVHAGAGPTVALPRGTHRVHRRHIGPAALGERADRPQPLLPHRRGGAARTRGYAYQLDPTRETAPGPRSCPGPTSFRSGKRTPAGAFAAGASNRRRTAGPWRASSCSIGASRSRSREGIPASSIRPPPPSSPSSTRMDATSPNRRTNEHPDGATTPAPGWSRGGGGRGTVGVVAKVRPGRPRFLVRPDRRRSRRSVPHPDRRGAAHVDAVEPLAVPGALRWCRWTVRPESARRVAEPDRSLHDAARPRQHPVARLTTEE